MRFFVLTLHLLCWVQVLLATEDATLKVEEVPQDEIIEIEPVLVLQNEVDSLTSQGNNNQEEDLIILPKQIEQVASGAQEQELNIPEINPTESQDGEESHQDVDLLALEIQELQAIIEFTQTKLSLLQQLRSKMLKNNITFQVGQLTLSHSLIYY